MFKVDTINGQAGWQKTGAYDAAVVGNSGEFGAQSLRISNAVTSGAFGDQTFSPSLVDAAGETTSVNGGYAGGVRQPHFEAQFRFASFDPVNAPAAAMVTSISPDRGDGGRMSYVRLEDAAGGIDVYFDDVTTNCAPDCEFVETQIATDLPRNVSHTIRFSMDFVEGSDNDVVKVYVDGDLLITGGSWENYYRLDPEAAGSQNKVPATDNLEFREGGAAVAGNANKGFLFDDVRLQSYGADNGPQGPQGESGTNGTTGTTGTNGTNGTNGKNGTNGTSGATGPKGDTGPAAPQGGVLGARANSGIALSSVRALLGKKGRATVALKVLCPKGADLCSGTVRLYGKGGKTLGSKTFDQDEGTSRISLRLSRSATRFLTKHKSLTVRVFARDGGGVASRATRHITAH